MPGVKGTVAGETTEEGRVLIKQGLIGYGKFFAFYLNCNGRQNFSVSCLVTRSKLGFKMISKTKV